ncbi:Uncharacterised protein [Mycobacteroides abscessus subsp. abscessus]|uniref:hypothetical protein n=1 Tax=Mycobacteroides abscessus TaxID=36809 RepID=UPI00092893D1|nr:hypothetical protein [Mycobacteroides abscessus]SIK10985.1 Uncharacterised protein [Mycobacteroides abscessus subsp. abscessus]
MACNSVEAALLAERTAAAIISDAEFARSQSFDDAFVYQLGDPAALILKDLWNQGQYRLATDIAVDVWHHVRASQRQHRWALWTAHDCINTVRMGLDGLGWNDADHQRFIELFIGRRHRFL